MNSCRYLGLKHNIFKGKKKKYKKQPKMLQVYMYQQHL